MKPFRFLLYTSLSFFVFWLGGCGYTQKVTLPSGIQTLHVDTFQNKIPLGRLFAHEPGVEIRITNAIIRRLEQDGNLKVVSRDRSDAILEGELIAFDQEGVRFTGFERIEEYRLYVVVSLRLKNQKTGEVLWEEPNFSGDTSFFVTGARSISRAQATDRAIDQLARNVVDRVVEDW
jgi:hypothetical protein